MKLLVISILFFLNGQLFAGSCLPGCMDNGPQASGVQGKHSQVKSDSSEHNCCPSPEKKTSPSNQHCKMNSCISSKAPDNSTLNSQIEIVTKQPTPEIFSKLTVDTPLKELTVRAFPSTHLNTNHRPIKVPLYIYFQKLLIYSIA